MNNGCFHKDINITIYLNIIQPYEPWKWEVLWAHIANKRIKIKCCCKRKIKRSDSVICQKPRYYQEVKVMRQHNGTTKPYTTIADRFRTVGWSSGIQLVCFNQLTGALLSNYQISCAIKMTHKFVNNPYRDQGPTVNPSGEVITIQYTYMYGYKKHNIKGPRAVWVQSKNKRDKNRVLSLVRPHRLVCQSATLQERSVKGCRRATRRSTVFLMITGSNVWRRRRLIIFKPDKTKFALPLTILSL